MIQKIEINESTKVQVGMWFDCNIRYKEQEFLVRMVYKSEIFVLSNNEKWNRHARTHYCLPEELCFRDTFKYSATLSRPRAIGESFTVRELVSLWNHITGVEVTILPNQVWLWDVGENVFLAPNYDSLHLYRGKHSYHHSHGMAMNRPKGKYKYRMGVELEVECNSEEAYAKIVDNWVSNWFFMERDGSLNDFGIEFVTIPLLPSDARSKEFWTPLCSSLKALACSWNSPRCGLHIHIGNEAFGNTPKQMESNVGKLLYLYHHHLKETTLNTKVFGRSVGFRDKCAKSKIGDVIEVIGSSALRKPKIQRMLDEDLKAQCEDYRYCDINIMNDNTIEFRRGKGSLAPERISAIATYCDLMVAYVCSTNWSNISYKKFVKFLEKNCEADSALLGYING